MIALRTRNFSKRPTENTPPAKACLKVGRRTNTRRTRKNFAVQLDVEQAKKKAQRNPVRLNVVIHGNSNVGAQDATQPPTIVPVLLPRAFLQPPACEPSVESIAAASPSYGGEPAAFIRDELESLGPQ